MLTVLFICIQNAGRSQMAEAFFNQMAGGKALAMSAGSRPAAHVHPVVAGVMNELGIDLSGKVPRKLTPELLAKADFVVTMGCGDACPVTGPRTTQWHIDDPSGKPTGEVRRIRDDIKDEVAGLIAELKLSRPD
jgi:arsenate reductase (thioredoxin)